MSKVTAVLGIMIAALFIGLVRLDATATTIAGCTEKGCVSVVQIPEDVSSVTACVGMSRWSNSTTLQIQGSKDSKLWLRGYNFLRDQNRSRRSADETITVIVMKGDSVVSWITPVRPQVTTKRSGVTETNMGTCW